METFLGVNNDKSSIVFICCCLLLFLTVDFVLLDSCFIVVLVLVIGILFADDFSSNSDVPSCASISVPSVFEFDIQEQIGHSEFTCNLAVQYSRPKYINCKCNFDHDSSGNKAHKSFCTTSGFLAFFVNFHLNANR